MEYKTLETGNRSKHNNQNNYQWNIKHQKQGTVTIKTKHNNQNNYQWNIKHQKQGTESKHNNQNNYQWNIKHQKQGTVENITIKTTTNGI